MIAVNGMSFYKIPFLLRFRFVGLGLAMFFSQNVPFFIV